MPHNAEITLQDPKGKEGQFPCPDCERHTTHTILTIVNSNHFDKNGQAQFWDHYLTVRCNGCGTVNFCQESKCSEEGDFTDEGVPFLVKHYKYYPGLPDVTDDRGEPFVEDALIEQIKESNTSKLDTTKLIQLLVELNQAYSSCSYLSCALLLRSVLDHIPPIFKVSTFSKVANNYSGGGKSFRDSMQHLENSSRKIADSCLHSQIRKTEKLITKSQVEFRADLGVLLGEINRVL